MAGIDPVHRILNPVFGFDMLGLRSILR